MHTKELLNNIEYEICNNKLTKEQVFTKMKHIIQTLERYDNSDYTVPASPAPKLPSFEDVEEYCNTDGNGLVPNQWIKRVYEAIKKLGNFA